MIGVGCEGFVVWFIFDEVGSYEMFFCLFGQGDFVVIYGKCYVVGKDIVVFDFYCVDGGKIVEYWMNEEEIGLWESWGNLGKLQCLVRFLNIYGVFCFLIFIEVWKFVWIQFLIFVVKIGSLRLWM